MKIIDLLNKIANGEELPRAILYQETEYRLKDDLVYWSKYSGSPFCDVAFDELNDEVEILETTLTYKPDKIEKLEIIQEKNCKNNWKWKLNGYNISTPQKIIADKINEIIDYINRD